MCLGYAETCTSFLATGCLDHKAMQVDVCDAASVERLFDAVKKFSPAAANIVVNCVGRLNIDNPTVVEMSEDVFDCSIRENLKGPFLVSRAAARAMLQAGVTDGAIVNVSSRAANDAVPRMSVYAAGKAAIVAFTRCMATELASRGIRCNSVMPGLTDSPPVLSMDDELRNALCASVPLGRPATTREIAEVVVFLCSPESSYVVGAAWVVAGGKQ
ncbi:estradiol 17-beta-dehydrogenase 8-like [Dermacentor silvarum]|uniref:estradiol 17-beta-dehydrogenase 8-like n=1 Tax=Dermacentor silvarum TaxID=543639 RepID=UPI002101AE08|nr:estradiol 17-beta-dehydrogenase 8-like [Dermacentor silvarum]